MKLQDWLDREERTAKWMASQIGSTRPMLSRWMRGHKVPHLWYVQRVHRVTGGEVSLLDWDVPPPYGAKPTPDDDA